MKNKPLEIDMIAGSEQKDISGETLSIEGCDIDDLISGNGRINCDHGKGFFNLLGTVTEAKKIIKAEDCESDRHRYYWEKVKSPYLYVKAKLFNNEDHPNARAAAAILKNIHREDIPLKLKASVEGGVISRGITDPTRLARTKIHSVALTFTPCNQATLVEPLNLDKSNLNWEADRQLIKSVIHLAETNIPSFRHIERHASANTIHENILKIQELAKAVGVDIEIKSSSPETIMKQATFIKVENNIKKINDLVKTLKYLPQKAQAVDQQKQSQQLSARDKYQQNIGKLKSDAGVNIPKVPTTAGITSSTNLKPSSPLLSGQQFTQQNTIKGIAARAMKDPTHLDAVATQFREAGHPEHKVSAILNVIRSHMAKSTNEINDLEKSDTKRAIKGVALAVGLAHGVNHINPPKEITDHASDIHNSLESEKKQVVKEHNSRVGHEHMKLDTKEYGFDERKPASYNIKIKKKLKKALMAGYGGSDAPTNLVSGGVIQSESLEKPKSKKKLKKLILKKSIEHISCDNCGKEQVYMQHQVKCRNCNQNFSFSKLNTLFK